MSHESETKEPKGRSKGGASLDDLHADFRQLRADVRARNQSGERAGKDRIEGFKRALRDILEAADRADREWQ